VNKKGETNKLAEEILERLKVHTERERRLERLDSALLYACALVGVIFSALQYLYLGWEACVMFVSVLVLACVFPFYIGYIRGAIKFDSVTERVRGWLYLYAGSVIYPFYVIDQQVVRMEIIPPSYSGLIRVMTFLIPVMIIYAFRDLLASKIFELAGSEPNDLDDVILKHTNLAALEFVLSASALYAMSINPEPVARLMWVVIFGMFVTMFMFSEEASRNYFNKRDKEYRVVVQRKGSPKIYVVAFVLLVLFFMLGPIVAMSESAERTTYMILLTVMAGIAVFLLVYSEQRRKLVFENE